MDEMGVPENVPEDGARVFLTRDQSSPRHIINMEEVKEVLEQYNFEIVDTASGMSIAEQMSLFAHTRYLIAIHGAGTTNIIYRRDAPLSILELHAQNFKQDDHRRIAREYGYKWDRLSGEPDDNPPQHANFTISVDVLEAKIQKMLNHESEGTVDGNSA